MNRIRRCAAAVLLAAAALPAAAAPAEDPPAPPAAPAPSAKEVKVRKLLEVMRWKDQVLLGLDESFDMQVRMGVLPKEFPKKFREVADFDALERMTVEEWMAAFEEKTLDAAIAFFGSEEGGKYTAASLVVVKSMMRKIEPWAMEHAMKAMAEIMGGEEEMEEEPATEPDVAADGSIGSNEALAIRALRNIATCQAWMQTSGKIDCDEDGIGEYGTLLELTGTVGVRRGYRKESGGERPDPAASDFSSRGNKVDTPPLNSRFSGVDEGGVARSNGYCFRIYLPDGAPAFAGFVHEAGPGESVGLAGDGKGIGVDLAETTWCVYAWPEKRGETGNRVFFSNQSGDVTQSPNEKGKWEGARGPVGNAAFRGTGITSEMAVGTVGRDGDVWKLVY